MVSIVLCAFLSARAMLPDAQTPDDRIVSIAAPQAAVDSPEPGGEPPPAATLLPPDRDPPPVIVTPVPDDAPPPGPPPGPPVPPTLPDALYAPPPGPPPAGPVGSPPADPGLGPAADDATDESPLEWRRRHDRFFLGLHPTVFAPVGGWTEHRLAGVDPGTVRIPSGVSQFGFGGGAAIELGWLIDPVLLILQTTIARLDVSDWEDAAAAAGTPVSAWAIWWDIAAMLVVDVVQTGIFALQLRGGLGIQQISGKETYPAHDVAYGYSFARPAADLRVGLGASFGVHETTDLVFAADFAAGVPGLDYAGEKREAAVMSFLLSIGIRLYPSAMRGD